MEKKYCTKCNKCMTDDKGTTIEGMQMIFRNCNENNPDMIEFFKKQLGKYELNAEYAICYECMIDNMLGK